MGIGTFFGRIGKGVRGMKPGWGVVGSVLELIVAALVFTRAFKFIKGKFKG